MKRTALVKALESLIAWAKEQPDEVAPFRLQPIPGLVVTVRDGPSSNAKKCRRYRERNATRVATGVERPPDTVSRPVSDTGLTRIATGVGEVSRPVSAPRPSSPPLHSPSDSLPPNLAKESVVAPKDLTGFPREAGPAAAPTRPQNHEEARQEPASFVAGLCMPGADPDRYDAQYASFVEVQRMPWVLEPVRAWRAARGDDRELMLDARSSEVKAMVRLVARGSMPSDLVRVARYLPTQAKYADKAHASCMTPDVVDIALAELREKPAPSTWARDLVRRADAAAGQPAALAGVLPRFAAGDGK